MNELLKKLTLEDIESPYWRDMAEVIGIEAFIKLISIYGGTQPYIPEVDKFTATIRNRLIEVDFNGGNYFHLATKWGLSERYVRTLTKKKAREIKLKPINGQIKFY